MSHQSFISHRGAKIRKHTETMRAYVQKQKKPQNKRYTYIEPEKISFHQKANNKKNKYISSGFKGIQLLFT